MLSDVFLISPFFLLLARKLLAGKSVKPDQHSYDLETVRLYLLLFPQNKSLKLRLIVQFP